VHDDNVTTVPRRDICSELPAEAQSGFFKVANELELAGELEQIGGFTYTINREAPLQSHCNTGTRRNGDRSRW
jgi:hypothetical protein